MGQGNLIFVYLQNKQLISLCRESTGTVCGAFPYGDNAGGGKVVSEEQLRNNHPQERKLAEPGRSIAAPLHQSGTSEGLHRLDVAVRA